MHILHQALKIFLTANECEFGVIFENFVQGQDRAIVVYPENHPLLTQIHNLPCMELNVHAQNYHGSSGGYHPEDPNMLSARYPTTLAVTPSLPPSNDHPGESPPSILSFRLVSETHQYARLVFTRPPAHRAVEQTAVMRLVDIIQMSIMNRAQLIAVNQLIIRDIHEKVQNDVTKTHYALSLLPSLVNDLVQFDHILTSVQACCYNTICCLNNIRDLIHVSENSPTILSMTCALFATELREALGNIQTQARITIEINTLRSTKWRHTFMSINFAHYKYLCITLIELLCNRLNEQRVNVSQLAVSISIGEQNNPRMPYHLHTIFQCSQVTPQDIRNIEPYIHNLGASMQTCGIIISYMGGILIIGNMGLTLKFPVGIAPELINETNMVNLANSASTTTAIPLIIDSNVLGVNIGKQTLDQSAQDIPVVTPGTSSTILIIAEDQRDRAVLAGFVNKMGFASQAVAFTDIKEFNAILAGMRMSISAFFPMAQAGQHQNNSIKIKDILTSGLSTVIIVEDYSNQLTTSKYNPAFWDIIYTTCPQLMFVVITKCLHNGLSHISNDIHQPREVYPVLSLQAPVERQQLTLTISRAVEMYKHRVTTIPQTINSTKQNEQRILIIHHCYITRLYLLDMLQKHNFPSTCAWKADITDLPITMDKGNIITVKFSRPPRNPAGLMYHFNVFLIDIRLENQYSLLQYIPKNKQVFTTLICNGLTSEEKYNYVRSGVNSFIIEPLDISQVEKCLGVTTVRQPESISPHISRRVNHNSSIPIVSNSTDNTDRTSGVQMDTHVAGNNTHININITSPYNNSRRVTDFQRPPAPNMSGDGGSWL